jgi:hypothetical protein
VNLGLFDEPETKFELFQKKSEAFIWVTLAVNKELSKIVRLFAERHW